MGSERGAGDDPERLLADPGDGQIGLDAAALVEQLRVDGRADRLVDVVGAEPIEGIRRSRARDVELRERGLVEEPRGVARRDALGADRRRPVAARPAVGPIAPGARGGVRVEPVDPLPAGLLAEAGIEGGEAVVGRRQPQRPAGRPLLAGIDDVVVARVGIERADPRVVTARVVRAEAPDVHRRGIDERHPLDDPLGDHPTDAARPREPVDAESGGDPEAGHLGCLAEDELAVGREGLGAVDDLGDLGPPQARDPPLRSLPGLGEPLHVGFEQRPRVAQRLVDVPGDRVAGVAADEQAAGLGTEVVDRVGIADRRGVGRDRRIERLGDQVLVAHRDDRDRRPGEPPERPRGGAGGDHGGLGRDRAAIGDHADHAVAVELEAGHADAGVERRAVPGGPLRQRLGRAARDRRSRRPAATPTRARPRRRAAAAARGSPRG